jgi:hypothetical protein
MDDLREALRTSVEDEFPDRLDLGAIRASSRRRLTRQRVMAATLGVVLAAAAVWIAVLGLGASDGPRPDRRPAGPLDVGSLRRSWSSTVEGTGFPSIASVFADDERIYVPTSSGIVAYPISCGDPCTPAWTVEFAGPSTPGRSVEIAVGEGVVAATLEGRLLVVASDCMVDGGECTPLWRADPPGSARFFGPSIGGGLVKVTTGQGEMPNHHVWATAFPSRCRDDGGPCDPTWTGDLGVGVAYLPGVFLDGVFYQQVGMRVTGFAVDCASSGEACTPDLVIDAAGDANNQSSSVYGPISGDGELIFVFGTGDVRSYPAHCGDACNVRWRGPVADYLEAYPTSAGALVLVSGPSGITAFPKGCASDGRTCDPIWETDMDRYVSVAHADEAWVVAVDHFDQTGVFVFSMPCTRACQPQWSLADVGPRIYGVTTDGRTLFVALRDEIIGYPLDCANPCAPVWRGAVSGETWFLAVRGRQLIAASRTDELGEGVTFDEILLTVFSSDP